MPVPPDGEVRRSLALALHLGPAVDPLGPPGPVAPHRPTQRHDGEHDERRDEHAEHRVERSTHGCNGCGVTACGVTAARLGDSGRPVTPLGHPTDVAIAPAPPRPPCVGAAGGGAAAGGGTPDILNRLRARATPRPEVDPGLAGGLRAWLEDGVAAHVGAGAGEASGAWRRGHLAPPPPVAAVLVRDGAAVARRGAARRGGAAPADLRNTLVRTVFRLLVSGAAVRQPFEDALCALSVTDRGPEVLDAVRRLRSRERAVLRMLVQARAATMAAQWHPVPPAWLPRTGERLRIPLGGGAVVLSATADLVLGRPSDGTASVCLVRLHEERGGSGGADAGSRTRRALALAETLRSGAPPWRVATYDPGTGRLLCDDADEDLLLHAVHDVLGALQEVR